MNVLITGGTGNIGSRLVVPLVRRGDRVVVFDIRSTPNFHSPEFSKAEVITGDLGDRDTLLELVKSLKIDSVFHFGAVLSGSAEENPYDAWRANMDGTLNILDAARLGGAQRVMFSSTVATYGEHAPRNLNDDSPQWPISLYGVTKVAGERMGVYYHHKFGLDFRAIRLPIILTSHAAAGAASAYAAAVFEHSVLAGEFDFWVNPTTRAPMLYIDDAVQSFIDLHDAPSANLKRRVYNIHGMSPSAEELERAVQARVPHARIGYKPDHAKCSIIESWPHQIDDSEAKRDWNWQPSWDLNKTADEIIGLLKDELQSK
ncbi:MAG TPA: NAD-dependent epimerase/dehydratase family protein [Terriglobales bacterium]|nr:NAD-dependent epimerase/dehydratase family protein [Terriglobales bacterium]